MGVSLAVLSLVVVTAACIDCERSIAGLSVLVLSDVRGSQCCIVEWSHPVAIDVKLRGGWISAILVVVRAVGRLIRMVFSTVIVVVRLVVAMERTIGEIMSWMR